ncbi:MAG: TIGR00341 family protein [Phycisphaerales bacterium]
MPSRLIQVACPASRREAALDAACANDRCVVDVFDSQERSLIRIVAPEECVEGLLDALQDALGPISTEGPPEWSIIVMHVEATLPRPPEQSPPGEESGPDAAEGESANGQSNKGRLSREELYEDIEAGSRITRSYIYFVALAAIVAMVGLRQGNPAVVVAAMVVAPLLGPNMALALAATLGDIRLGARAGLAATLGFGIAVVLAAAVAQIMPLDPAISEVAMRTRATAPDIALALASGVAGALAFLAGGKMSVVGVMVAVALLPPTAVFGAMAGQGEWRLAGGALVLTMLNVVAVNLAGVATFLATGIRPRHWWEQQKARRLSRIVLGVWVAALLALAGLIVVLSDGGAG